MKKILLSFLIVFSGLFATAHAEVQPAFYDFEDYTAAHSAPAGWGSSNNIWELSPGTIDAAHGTSLEVSYNGLPTYIMPEAISSGKFLMSFEAYFKDSLNMNVRMHLFSPTSGVNSHSIFYFTKNGAFQDSKNAGGAWEFSTVATYLPNEWNTVDLLFDMDEKMLTYYLNGKSVSTKNISFQDFSQIYLRTDGGVNGTKYYLDNVSFKFLSDGNYKLDESSVTAGSDTVKVIFSDLVDKNTLSGLKFYDMGSNAVNYTSQAVGISEITADAKIVTLKLSSPIAPGKIYKVSAPGAKTLFGDSFTNAAAYAATGGLKMQSDVVGADFTTATAVGTDAAVDSSDGYEWIKSGRTAGVYPIDSDGDLAAEAIHFAPHMGNSLNRKNGLGIKREFNTAFDSSIVLQYKMKSVTANQTFFVYDSLDTELEMISVQSDGIYNGGVKIADSQADWFTVKIDADLAADTADIYINDVAVKNDADISAITDIKAVKFYQENTQRSYPANTFTDYAESYLEYFKVRAEVDVVTVLLISFEDSDGNIIYPEESIDADIKKINVKFSDAVTESTLDGNIKLEIDGSMESFTSAYNAQTNTYTMNLPEYLKGGDSYILTVTDGVKDATGVSVAPITGTISTKAGEFKAKTLSVSGTDSITLNANVVHTDESNKTMYLIYAAYKENLLIDLQYVEYTPTASDRNVTISSPAYTRPADADMVKGFLWDGFDTKIPLINVQIGD